MARTQVVILNWNTSKLLQQFLPPLIKSCEKADAEVVVADNASSDGSLDAVHNLFPNVRTLSFDENLGFTGGYNKALSILQDTGSEFFVLLNSDVEVTPEWLNILTGWMDSHPDCAACAPKLHSYTRRDDFEYAGAAGGLIDAFGYPFCRGRIPGVMDTDRGQYDNTNDGIMWVSGACMMVRNKVWNELGGLDSRFFAHMEEIDFCWRAQIAGYSINTVPAAVVYHLGGATLPATSPFKLHLNYRNNLLMLRKNLPVTIGPVRARFRIAVRSLLDMASALVYLASGKTAFFKAVISAHRDYRRIVRTSAASNEKAWKAPVPQSPSLLIQGYTDILILPLRFICGRNSFKYIQRYEDNHRRSR